MKQIKKYTIAGLLMLLGIFMVSIAYSAAPTGGYLPNQTNDPDCIPNETDCFVIPTTDTNPWFSQNNSAPATSNTENIYSMGNVGIGTATPQNNLDILDDNPTLKITDSDGTVRSATLLLSTLGGSWNISNKNDLLFQFGSNDPSVVFTRAGKVGIGDLTPDTGDQELKLDVEGAIGATHYCDDGGNNCVTPSELLSLSPVSRRLVLEGDSLTSTANYWHSVLDDNESFFLGAEIINNAVGGARVNDHMLGEYTTQVQPHKKTASNEDVYFFLFGGTNDLYRGRSATDIYEDLKTLWAQAREDDFKVVAFTIHSISEINSTSYTAADEVQRLALNELIASDISLFDYLIRPDIIFTNPEDLTYYTSDGVHLNLDGQHFLGEHVAATIAYKTYENMIPVTGATIFSGDTSNDSLLNDAASGYISIPTLSDGTTARGESEDVFILDNGYIGIGINAPSAKLHIEETLSGSSTSALHLRNGDNAVGTEVRAYFTPNVSVDLSRSAYIGAKSETAGDDSELIFATNIAGASAVEQMRIDSMGNVGIGTATPQNNLDILDDNPTLKITDSDGTVRSATLLLSTLGGSWNISNKNDLFFQFGSNDPSVVLSRSDGKVGVGTTTPARKLHISDAMRLEPTSGSQPATPKLGDLYVDGDTNELCFYNGTVWAGTTGGTCD